jgi:DNA-directed RNA polymerase subunit M/transcription elongation factor TFIIS
MSITINNFDAIKFGDGNVKGDASLVMETRTIEVEVERTREIQVPVEYTRDVEVEVTHTREVEVPVEHTREVMVEVEHTREVEVPVEHTREVMVDVEYTREVQVPVEHTREVMVDVEYTRDVQVPVEHTREVTEEVEHTREVQVEVEKTRDVQVIDTDAMQAGGAYQNANGEWVIDREVESPANNVTGEVNHMVDIDETNDLFTFSLNGPDTNWTASVGEDFDALPAVGQEVGWTDIDLNASHHTDVGAFDMNEVHHSQVDDTQTIGFDSLDRVW